MIKGGMLLLALVLVLAPVGVLAQSADVQKGIVEGATGKLTFRVVDARGAAVPNAQVEVGFYMGGRKGGVRREFTDGEGLLSVVGRSKFDAHYRITRDGSYKSKGTYQFAAQPEATVVNGEWQPWNPTIPVLLKERRRPTRMIAREVSAVIPKKDAPIGYDLEVGDWVAPYGRGTFQDLVVTYRSTYRGPQDFEKSLLITFANPDDGVIVLDAAQGSELISEYEAPVTGYASSLALEMRRTEDVILSDVTLRDDQYLIFRVRATRDQAGNITGARYGKIYPKFDFGQIDRADRIVFTSYFNPDGSRNIEFEVGGNLLPERAPMDRIWRP